MNGPERNDEDPAGIFIQGGFPDGIDPTGATGYETDLTVEEDPSERETEPLNFEVELEPEPEDSNPNRVDNFRFTHAAHAAKKYD